MSQDEKREGKCGKRSNARLEHDEGSSSWAVAQSWQKLPGDQDSTAQTALTSPSGLFVSRYFLAEVIVVKHIAL